MLCMLLYGVFGCVVFVWFQYYMYSNSTSVVTIYICFMLHLHIWNMFISTRKFRHTIKYMYIYVMEVHVVSHNVPTRALYVWTNNVSRTYCQVLNSKTKSTTRNEKQNTMVCAYIITCQFNSYLSCVLTIEVVRNFCGSYTKLAQGLDRLPDN